MKKYRCKSCGSDVEGKGRYHTGFNDTGFLYCDRDSTVLTFSSFDPKYEAVAGAVHPWVLTQEGRSDVLRAVEDRLVDCPCGGRFSFDNPLRCPICGDVFSRQMSKNIYFIVLARRLDGEKKNVWKD
jgi:hypothetical protein